VTADHIRSAEDLHDHLILFSSWARNSLDSKLWRSGDVDAVQQIPQSASGDRIFISGSLDFIGLMVHLVLLRITQGSVILVVFIFSLIAFFFFSLMIVVIVMVTILVVMVIVVAIVLWQLFSFFCCFLIVFSHRYHDHDPKGILLLRNILTRVVLRLLLRWYIS
jgi:hypothetical protein